MNWRAIRLLAVGGSLLTAQSSLNLNQTGDPSITRPVGSLEIEQLRRDIADQSGSSVELIGDYHTESGDLNNRLDYWRAGARLNYVWQAGTTFYLSGVRTGYRTLEDVFDGSGLNFTAGIKAAFTESVDGRFEVGATRFNTDTSTVNALASVNFRLSDAASMFFSGSRSNVEESLLSTTGLRPATGPFAGRLVGRVMDNRIGGGLLYKLPYNFDLSGEGNVGMRDGSNIDNNHFRYASGSLFHSALSDGQDDPVNSFRLGYQFQYLDFDVNRLGYGGASLTGPNGRPLPPSLIGAGGVSPEPGPNRAGVGGYFSPQDFMSHTGRAELEGRPSSWLRFRASGFAGTQEYQGSPMKAVYGFTGTLEWILSDRFSIPVTFMRDNYGPFTQQTLWVRLVVGI